MTNTKVRKLRYYSIWNQNKSDDMSFTSHPHLCLIILWYLQWAHCLKYTQKWHGLNRDLNCQCTSRNNSCCNRELLWVLVNEYYCIWSSIMQKLKNILGSRKKGAQEPHAAREPRNDYQGYTTSNLKGISLERLTLSAGMTSFCMCPLFSLLSLSTIEDCSLILLNMRFCFASCLCSESSVLMQDESRSLGDVAIDMDSQTNPLQLQLIDEQVDQDRCWKRWPNVSSVHLCFLTWLCLKSCCSCCPQDSYIQSRADTMQNIESTIVELGSIFQQLAHMVKEQEETIQRWDGEQLAWDDLKVISMRRGLIFVPVLFFPTGSMQTWRTRSWTWRRLIQRSSNTSSLSPPTAGWWSRSFLSSSSSSSSLSSSSPKERSSRQDGGGSALMRGSWS